MTATVDGATQLAAKNIAIGSESCNTVDVTGLAAGGQSGVLSRER